MKNVKIIGNQIYCNGIIVAELIVQSGTIYDKFIRVIQNPFLVDAEILKEKLRTRKNQESMIELTTVNDVINSLL